LSRDFGKSGEHCLPISLYIALPAIKKISEKYAGV
jgi:hypothetical protein